MNKALRNVLHRKERKQDEMMGKIKNRINKKNIKLLNWYIRDKTAE